VKSDPSRILIHQREDLEEDEELTSLAIKRSPPWLVSLAYHMALMIVLGLLYVAGRGDGGVELIATMEDEEEDIWAEKLGNQNEYDSPLAMLDNNLVQEPILAISELPEVEDPFSAPPDLEIFPDGTLADSDLEHFVPGSPFNGRQKGSRNGALGEYGGNKTTEEAVLAALRWLARNQRPDGSWSLCGPYTGGVPQGFDNECAATAMALLAFQGNGNTHKTGPFKTNVIKGWNWLLKQQDGDGNFYHEPHAHQHFYTQGQCAIAICELYGMTQDKKYQDPAQRSIQFLLDSQSVEGGWRYNPRGSSDVSVTGWIVMALQSARMAGLEVPQDHFDRVTRYLDSVQEQGGSRYPYQKDGKYTLAMTAEALLCREYLGWTLHDERLVDGLDWITQPGHVIDYGPRRNTYYWYYATQACFHVGGEHWRRWNKAMLAEVPRHQVPKGQREHGSWDPDEEDRYEVHGGRLYSTCLQTYMLEVYYRHMPLFKKIYSEQWKTGRPPELDEATKADEATEPAEAAPPDETPEPDAIEE